MRLARTICSYLIIALGVLHGSLTRYSTGSWTSEEALVFLLAGLAILLLGGVNLIVLRAEGDPIVRWVGIAANTLGSALFGLGVYAFPMPQVYALFALLVFELGGGITASFRQRARSA